MEKTVALIICAPCASTSKEDLEKEQPGLEEINCPHCGYPMWISTKKRILVKKFGKDGLICYACFEEDKLGVRKQLKDIKVVNIG